MYALYILCRPCVVLVTKAPKQAYRLQIINVLEVQKALKITKDNGDPFGRCLWWFSPLVNIFAFMLSVTPLLRGILFMMFSQYLASGKAVIAIITWRY